MTVNNQTIDVGAARWSVRLSAGPLGPQEQAELNEWLATDARHRGALLRARAAWLDLDRLAALANGKNLGTRLELSEEKPEEDSERCDIADAELIAHRDASSERSSDPRSGQSRVRARRMRRSATADAPRIPTAISGENRPAKRTKWMKLAPFAAAATLVAVVIGIQIHMATSFAGDHYSTPVGGLNNVRLADGSDVTLNTDTSIYVQLKDKERRIELDKGEALFQVAKDPARPFIVRTGSVSVRAVGTVFSVRTVDQRVDVTVTEGVVEVVDDNGLGPGAIRRIAANQHATVVDTRQVQVEPLPPGQADRRLAWREGMVAFDGEPLTDAVEEMNRHNHRHIIVDDPELAARPVVGLFRANDPEDFAVTVAIALGAQSLEQDGTIHVRPVPLHELFLTHWGNRLTSSITSSNAHHRCAKREKGDAYFDSNKVACG